METIIRTEKLCKSFSNGGLQQHIIKNLDMEIRKNDFTIIMGASGSGKSTLLYALSGMDTPTLGSVYFGDEDISKYYTLSGCSPDQPRSGRQERYEISSSEIVKPNISIFSFILSADEDLGITGMPRWIR